MLILLFLILLVVFMLPSYPEPRVLKGFISQDECDHIMNEAKDKLVTSTIASDRTVDESIRKSETAWLNPSEDPIVADVIRRCLKHTDRPVRNCEHLQVLRYRKGGHYKPHQDIFPNDSNMRMYTFILALNDTYEGGQTVFPNIGKVYKLDAGDALFFDTLDNYELDTSKALHGGAPVKSGEKWVCNLWVRKYAFPF